MWVYEEGGDMAALCFVCSRQQVMAVIGSYSKLLGNGYEDEIWGH